MKSHEGWTEVRRRKSAIGQYSDQDNQTFFISGLPGYTEREGIRRCFMRFGQVIDVYSPFKPCPFEKVVESEDEDDERDEECDEEMDEDSDGVSDTWRAGMNEDDMLEDGEFIPGSCNVEEDNPGGYGSPAANMENANVGGVGPEFEETTIGGNDGMSRETNGENEAAGIGGNNECRRDFDVNIDKGMDNDVSQSVGAPDNMTNGLLGQNSGPSAQLPPLGCFGPFPSMLGHDVGKFKMGNGLEKQKITFTGSRDKRRRILSGNSPSSMPNLVATQLISPSVPTSIPLDLNNAPQNVDRVGDAVSTSEYKSINSADEEIRATVEVGKRIGFQIDEDSLFTKACGGSRVEENCYQ
ncbi:hypothetical protein L1887_10954 [Cichorium endivia]|nr:hypothetical protein L1887_10954 [Cichorium endivia]